MEMAMTWPPQHLKAGMRAGSEHGLPGDGGRVAVPPKALPPPQPPPSPTAAFRMQRMPGPCFRPAQPGATVSVLSHSSMCTIFPFKIIPRK